MLGLTSPGLALASRASALIAISACLFGCSALVNPDSDRLGVDPGVDSGPVFVDSGGVGVDGGVRPDAGGVMCTDGAQRCAGDTLFTCAGGMEVARDCQAMGQFCMAGECMAQVCTPNQRECSASGAAVVSCSARGHEVTRQSCPNGCDPATIQCRPDGGSCEDGIEEIEVGDRHRVNLCDGMDEFSHQSADGCGSMGRATAPDQMFSLRLERMQRVTIELTDVDSARAIDTIVYVRRECDVMGSQVACDDDVPCDESTAEPAACFGSVDVRQSRITVTLPAGTYYIVVDGFEYTTDRVAFGCGEVELSVSRDSPFPFP